MNVARVAVDVLGVDAEHGAAARGDPLVPALEQRRLVAAGRAPRGPDVEDDDLAPVVGERPRRPVAAERRQLERRRRRPLAARDGVVERRVAVAARQPVREQRHERDRQGHDDQRGRGGEGASRSVRRVEPGPSPGRQDRGYTGPHADVAQLVERRLPKPKVAGSRPVVRFHTVAATRSVMPLVMRDRGRSGWGCRTLAHNLAQRRMGGRGRILVASEVVVIRPSRPARSIRRSLPGRREWFGHANGPPMRA